MDYGGFIELLTRYGADKLMPATAALILSLCLKKTLVRRNLGRLASALPFISGVVLGVLFRCMSDSVAEVIDFGLSAGGAATVLYALASGLNDKGNGGLNAAAAVILTGSVDESLREKAAELAIAAARRGENEVKEALRPYLLPEAADRLDALARAILAIAGKNG